jgi:hypothetical protein
MKLSHWEPDLRTITSWVENGEIDLQPNFQRGDIWPLPKKRKLIDTVLRGWSIPPIHVVVSPSGTLDVLDGQQRLTAIRDFMRGDFGIDGSIEPADALIQRLAGFRYGDLPTEVRRSFDQYTLRVFRITEYKPEEPGELFYRLNQPLILTPGEQRNALYGPARAQLKHLVEKFQIRGNTRETIGFSNARMSYDDVFAKLIFFIEKRTFAVKATEAAISDRFKLAEPFDEELIERTNWIVDQFSAAREAASVVKLNKATLLSWFLFYARATDRKEETDYLREFEIARQIHANKSSSLKLPHHGARNELNKGADYVRLFVDRASLRVSDVSSVVYRDFALWAVYALNYKKASINVSIGDIMSIDEVLRERADIDAELALDQELDVQRWAQL